MELVENQAQVERNICTLEKARRSSDDSLRSYQSLIKRGTCFVVYESDSGVAFAPSKFIGYVNNALELHIEDRRNRDGRDTNKALAAVFGHGPELDTSAEAGYRAFCERIGIQPGKTGTAGAKRKFWIPENLSEVLSDFAIAEIEGDSTLTQTEKRQLVKARLGQGQFRTDLFSVWRACCLTGCSLRSVLKASHIKPWCKSDNTERLDKFNGLLLSPNADALFDRGYISFSDAGELMISPQLSEDARKALLIGCKKRISILASHLPYLAYHRAHCFRGKAAQPGVPAEFVPSLLHRDGTNSAELGRRIKGARVRLTRQNEP